MLDLSIIIVSYNTKNFLKEAIESVLKTVPESIQYEIIVSDNDSQDGSIEEVKQLQKGLKQKNATLILIENKANLGFSKGNNVGVKKAKGKYVLFLNPDTVTREKTIEYMVKFMDEHPDAGASTCKLEMLNGQIDYASHRGFPSPWNAFCFFSGLTKRFPTTRLFSGYTQGWKDLTKTHEIDCLAGAFMLVRWEAGEQVKWWDEDYFFNGEDIDFCYELRNKDWKIYYVPEVSILHYNGVAGGTKEVTAGITTANKERKRFVTQQRFKAMRIFYDKHYKTAYPSFVTQVVLLGISFKEYLTLRKYR